MREKEKRNNREILKNIMSLGDIVYYVSFYVLLRILPAKNNYIISYVMISQYFSYRKVHCHVYPICHHLIE